jgi:hypothetical protein
MRNMVNNYYDLMTFGLGNQNFQQFVDKFQLKYNAPQADGFVWDSEIQLDYTYEQLIASLGITTLPVYVDADSEGLDKSLGQFTIGSNKIPTQKHRYAMNAKMLRERMLMVQKFGDAALNSDTRSALMDMLFDSTDKLLGGNRNAITHQRMRICSTGQFTIDLENNPRGIQGITFDFGIPAANKETLSGTARWWTNAEHTKANEGSASDPLLFLKNKRKAMKKAGFPAGHFEMSEDLFDDLLMHSKVLQSIGYALYPAAADATAAQSYAQNLTDDVKKDAIARIIGAPIKTYDSVAAVEKYDAESKSIKPVTVENFKATNVSFIPDGQIGTIKSVRPMVFTDDPTQRIAWFDGGRTLVTNRFESKTKTMYVESEMAVLCVPNMPQYMCIFTVTV